jgi:hypothetical protein
MRRSYLFLAILLFGLMHEVPAQTVVDGFVRDSSLRTPVDRVAVVLGDRDGKNIAGYCITDTAGYFRLAFSLPDDTVAVSVSALGYKSQRRLVRNRSQKLDFLLSEKAIELEEVVVKASPVVRKGDTTIYAVEAFTTSKDRVIGDVLRNMPGIDISATGAISYQGKPISQFHIEGMDLLGGKYRLATDNIPSDAVQSVEMIENFEPVRALRGLGKSERTAINLKLKKERKLHPFGTLSVGAGGFEDFLRDVNAFAMNVSSGSQTIATFKINNAGKNLRSELTDFIPGSSVSGSKPAAPAPLRGDAAGSPPTRTERSLFNDTYVWTVNSLKKISEDKQLKINASYEREKTVQRVEQVSSYFLPDSMLPVHETKKSVQKMNVLEMTVHYKNNAERDYVNNTLKGKVNFAESQTDVFHKNSVFETYKLPDYLLENNLQYTKRKNAKTFTLKSYTRWASSPQQAEIYQDTAALPTVQQASRSGFYTNGETSFSHYAGRSSFGLKVNLEGSLESLHSELRSEKYVDSLENSLSFDYIKLGLTPAYLYDPKRNFTVAFNAPVAYQTIFVHDRIYTDRKNIHLFHINPSLRFSYQIHPFLKGSIIAGNMTSYGVDALDYTQSYMALNYRSINKTYSGVVRKSNMQNYTVSADYNNIFKFFNSRISASYSTALSNVISDVRFENGGDLSVSSNQNVDVRNENWRYQAHASKYISRLKGKIALTASYSLSSSKRMQQSVLMPVRNGQLALTPEFSFKLNRMFDVAYKYNFSGNRQTISMPGKDRETSYRNTSHNLSVYYFILENLSINLSGEYLQNHIAENKYKSLYFADAGLSYRMKKMEFALQWNNLFNQDKYVYTIQSLDTYTYAYALRPSSVLAKVLFKY